MAHAEPERLERRHQVPATSHLVAVANARPHIHPMTPAAPVTAEQLLHTRLPDRQVELVRGVLVVREPLTWRHGRIAMNLAHQQAR